MNPAKVHESLGGGGPLGVSPLLHGLGGDRASSQPVLARRAAALPHCHVPPWLLSVPGTSLTHCCSLLLAVSTLENSVQPA